MNKKMMIKMGAFLLVVALLFGAANQFFQRDWNAEALNIYDEPRNTVEILFIGSSMTEFGINVMTLYEEYGICAYNLGNSGQPVMQSYYWLEEAYKYQSESLKTIVFDVSIMKSDLREEYYRTATENMKLSTLKYDAVSSYADDLNQTISYMFPLFSYHTRWNELTSADFGVATSMLYKWSRGQCFSTDTPFQTLETEELIVWDYTLDETAECYELDEEGIEYFQKMQEFCEKNSLELILIKTPNPLTWNSSDHNTFEQFAQENDVVFLDFNFAPLVYEMDYDCMFDSMDGIHLNYYGSEKFALWFGKYLIENGYAHDIRGEEKYAFMEEDLAQYKEEIGTLVALRECMDPVDYLTLANQKENYVIFITVKTDAANALTDEQRNGFSALGLEKLSELSKDAPYVAVMEHGEVVYERSKDSNGGKLTYKGELKNGILYSLVSGGDVASCKIEGSEYARKQTGLNIVVYDKEQMTVVDRAVFDTSVSAEREVQVWDVLEAKLAEVDEDAPVPENLKKFAAYLELLEGEK